MMSREDALEFLESTEFGPAGLDETQLMREIFVHEDEKITDLEKRIMEVTRANFTVFGAVALFSNTSFFIGAYGSQITSYVALAVIGFVSLAASIYIVFIHKYIRVQSQKVRILQQGIWRRRPLAWLEAKYAVRNLQAQFRGADRLGWLEFLTHRYTMKTINLIPFVVALFGASYISSSHEFWGRLLG